MSTASAGFPEIFNCDFLLVASTPCFIGLSSTLSDLIELVRVGSILHGADFDFASYFFASHTMWAVVWENVSSIAENRQLPYDFVRGLVSRFPSPDQAHVVVNGRDTYTGLLAVPSVTLLQDLPTLSQVREAATRHFHHVHSTALLA